MISEDLKLLSGVKLIIKAVIWGSVWFPVHLGVLMQNNIQLRGTEAELIFLLSEHILFIPLAPWFVDTSNFLSCKLYF